METTNFYDLKDKCGYKPGTILPHVKYGYDPAVVIPWPSMGGGMKKRLKDRIERLNLSTKHHIKTLRKMMPVNLLKSGRRSVLQLRKKLETSGRQYICELCHCEGMTLEHGKWLWRDWPLVLQVDHINGLDGTEDQDRLDNLRYLCPSCHAQRSNHCGKSDKKRGKNKSNLDWYRACMWCFAVHMSKPLCMTKQKRRSTGQLRKLLDESGRLYICDWCRCEKMTLENGEWLWRGLPLTLQIDHIHGVDGTDNQDRVDNLRYLCPNCHSQTSNFCGKQQAIRKKRGETAFEWKQRPRRGKHQQSPVDTNKSQYTIKQ